MSRWKSSGKSLRTTKYLTKLATMQATITAVIISFFKGYLKGFSQQEKELNIMYSNAIFAATGIYLILPHKLSSSWRIRKPLMLLLRRLARSLRQSQILKIIRLRSSLLKGLKKGRPVSLLIVRLVLQERCITLLYTFKALTPTITTLSRLLFKLFLQIIIRSRTYSII